MTQTINRRKIIERGAEILHAINPGTSIAYFTAHLSRTDKDWSVGYPLADHVPISQFLKAMEKIG